MSSPTDLLAASNANLVTAFGRFAEHFPGGARRRFGPIEAVSSGLAVPKFNRVFVFDTPELGPLRAAVEWTATRENRFWVTTTASLSEAVGANAAELGLEKRSAVDPGMVLPLSDGPSAADAFGTIAEVTDPDDLDAFARIYAAAFDHPLEVIKVAFTPSFLTDDDVAVFLGRVDGEPVACGLLVRTGEVAGVYSVGVLEAFRRRGIGTALTRAVLDTGRGMGCTLWVLQATPVAVPLYEGMGFEAVVDYHYFEPVS